MCIQPEFSEQRTVRCRKPHKCCECHRWILPGQQAELVGGMWDGEFQKYYTCLACVEIRKEAAHDGITADDECGVAYIYGQLGEDLHNNGDRADLIARFDELAGKEIPQ